MIQVLFGLTSTSPTSGQFLQVTGYQVGISATENLFHAPWSAPGVFRNLVVDVETAPGAGTSRTLTLRKNGVDTALTATISGTATTARLTGVDVAIAAGDRVVLQNTVSGAPVASRTRWTLEFEGTTANQSGYCGPLGAASNAATRYVPVFNPTIFPTVAATAQNVVAAAGTLTRTDATVSSAPAAGNGFTFYVNKNGVRQDGTGGTVNTACALTSGITQNSTTYSVALSPGDVVYLEAIATGTFSSSRNWAIGTAFTATTAGHSQICGSVNALSTTVTETCEAIGMDSNRSATETLFLQRALPGVTTIQLSGLRVLLSAAPTAGKSRLIEVRRAGASVGPTVTVSDAATTGSDLVNTALIADGANLWNLRTVPAGTPPSTSVYWGIIQGAAAVTVPDVVGLTEAAAETALIAAGLVKGTVTTASSLTVPAGDVISQSPTAGSSVAPGSAVALVISTGVPLTTVPNVVGMTTAAADAALVAVGLSTGTLTTATHPSAPAGTVISQSPTAGSAVTPGSAVALVISLGPLDQSIKPAAIVEVELDGVDNGWTALTLDVLRAPGIVIRRGIDETRPDARVASTGTASFGLNNSASNSVGLLGYYSPHHVNLRPGFGLGIRCRVSLQSPDLVWRVQFLGRLDAIDPLPGAHGARQVLVTAVDWLDEAARWRLTPAIGEQIDKSWDAVLTAILAEMPVQPAAVSLNGGSETWPYALDTSEVSQQTALAEFVKLAQSEYGLIYQRADGTLRAEDRHFRMTTTAAVWTLTDAEFQDLELPSTRDDLLNTVRVTTHPRTVSPVANVVVYDQANVIELAAGETKMLMGSYRDPVTGDAIGATEIQPQVVGTDLIANTAADGSGSLVSSSIGVVIEAGQSGVRFDVTNGTGAQAFLTTLRLLGKAIYDHGATVHEATDAASISLHGEHALDYDMPYQVRQDVGQAAAEYILAKYKDPLAQAHSLTVIGRTPELLLQILTRDISDRITLSETVTGADDTYFINAVELTIHAAGHASARYTLTPADDPATLAGYFILDISALDGPDILAPF